MFKKKKIGLALSGGLAKGFAHIGVLKVFEQNNINIDMVSGTSMGSIIGAMYCMGYSTSKIEKIINESSLKDLIDLAFPKKGLIKGKKIEDLLRKIFENKKFSDLKKPFFVTAVDILNSKEIIFKKGDISKAVRASISIPGIFEPVLNNKRVLVDGGILDNTPIDILRKNKADIIIAVNLSEDKTKEMAYDISNNKNENFPYFGITSILLKSFELMRSQNKAFFLKNLKADIIISPNLEGISAKDFDKMKLCIKRGEDEAKKSIKTIKKLIFEKKFKNRFSRLFLKNKIKF
jgi:NTE family protein